MKKLRNIKHCLLLGLLITLQSCSTNDFGSKSKAITDQVPTITISLNCNDQALISHGSYRVENNTWGKKQLSNWSQCVGLVPITDTSIQSKWTWDWRNDDNSIKAYPEIIFGKKPGKQSSTTLALPILLSNLNKANVSYNITSTHTGSGDTAFDIWLTDSEQSNTFAAPPIKQEVMIWLENFGGLIPSGQFVKKTTIDNNVFDVYVGENFGLGWRYIVFSSDKPLLGTGHINLLSFFSYLKDNKFVDGNEYLSSIELGNEIVNGTGETILNYYNVSIR